MRLLLSILFYIFLLVNLTFSAARKGEPPQINRHIESIIRIPEETKIATIICPVRSNPKNDGVIVHWLKDGEEIGTEWPQYKFTNNNRELKIKEPQRHDAGVYTCRAVNGFGHAEVDFTLDIYDPGNDIPLLPNESIVYATKPSPPIWFNEGEEVSRQTRNGPIYLSPGERLELRCPAVGNPLPVITWYKNDHPLDMGELRRHNDAKLQLDDVTRNDSGRYTCALENRHGTIRETFVVIVGRPGVAIKKLKNSFEHELDSEAWGGNMKNTPIIDAPQNATIYQGKTAKFTCHLSGSKLNFRWLKQTSNPAEATITIRNKTFTILEQNENSTIATTNAKGNKIQSNTLVIESATEADNGKYFCVITGDDGYVGYRSAQLNVIPRPAETSPIFFETTLIVFAGIFVFFASLIVVWLTFYCRGSSKGSHQSKSTCSGSDCYPTSSNGTSTATTKKTMLPPLGQFQPIPPPPPRIPLPEAPTMSFSPVKPPNTYALPPLMGNTPTGSPLLYNGERRLRQPPSATLDRRYRPQPQQLLHRTYAEDEMSRLSSNIYDSGSPLPPPPSHAGVPSSNSSHVYCTTSPKLGRYQRQPIIDQMDGYGYDDGFHGYNYREQQPFVNSSQRW
jgi:hypothetical protein